MDDLWNGVVRWNFAKGLPWERGEDFLDVPGRETMSWARRGSSVVVMLATAALSVTVFVGCKTQERKAEPVSQVAVEILADGIHLKTARAEFLLAASGGLSGRFNDGTQWLSLDEISPSSGVLVSSDKKEVSDFVRDVAHAQIQAATGKLGALGKRVVIRGRSATTALD